MTMTMATSGDEATGWAMNVTAQDASPGPQGPLRKSDRRHWETWRSGGTEETRRSWWLPTVGDAGDGHHHVRRPKDRLFSEMNGGMRKPSGEKKALFTENRSILTPMGVNRRFNVIELHRAPRWIPLTVSGGCLSDPGQRIRTAHSHHAQRRQVASREW